MPRFQLRRRQPPAAQLAEQVAELLKASVPGLGALPVGTATTTATTPAMPGARGDQQAALPRTDPLVAFGPGRPIYPAPLDPRRPGTQRAEPRRYEYPVSWNLHTSAQHGRLLEWKILRDFADRIDMVRRCIELRKSELVSIDWDITIDQKALNRVMAATDEKNEARAARTLRDKYEDDIERLVRFWQQPDPVNLDGWDDWLSMALEEHFVLDALTIYPRMTLGGDLFALEILDGSTIKPLLDYRGGRPMPPAPAYQQILYGFPRGEFTASDSTLVEGEYGADQLVYRPRVRRTFTPYGMSNTEQALMAGALYAKRQKWLGDEYDEGTTPRTWMRTDSDYSPDNLRAYESVLNDELAGDNAERMRAKLLNRGFDPVEMKQFEEMYKPDFDEHLIRLLCVHFDVMPTEIGFPPRHGLGGKGHQEGEENTTYRKAIKPLLGWLVSILNNLSTTYLQMPADLTFTFQGLEVEDELNQARARDLDIRNGTVTLNGIQAQLSRPLYDFPEADMPFVVTGSGVTFLEGASEPEPAPVAPIGEQGQPPGPVGPPAGNGKAPPAAGDRGGSPAQAEARKFATFAEKRIKAGKVWRDFAFTTLDADTAGRLNQAGAAGDLDLVKAAVADVGKAGARQGRARPREVQDWPGWRFDQTIASHYALILQRLLTGLGNWPELAAEYLRVHGASKATAITPERAAARSFVHQHLSSADLTALVVTLRLLYTDGYLTGNHAATVMLERLGVQATATLAGRVSWSDWRPGDPETARLLEAAGDTPGLAGLLHQAEVTIKSVRDGYLNRLGDTLAAGVQRGASVDELARDLRDLLTIDRATMIAHTETARAMTTAAMETYRANQVAGYASISAEDQRVCEQCAANEAAGPIPLGDSLPFGSPPVHPLCRCSIVPYLASEMGLAGEPVVQGFEDVEE